MRPYAPSTNWFAISTSGWHNVSAGIPTSVSALGCEPVGHPNTSVSIAVSPLSPMPGHSRPNRVPLVLT